MKRELGFALFLAWSYYSLFSCGLLPAPFVFGNIEPVWIWAGLLMAITSVLVIVLSKRFSLLASNAVALLAAAGAALGSLLIWAGYLDPAAHHAVSVAGGVFCGIGMALMTCIWGRRLVALEEEYIAFAVPVSFVIAIVVYFALIAIKGVASMVVDVALPFLSVFFILHSRAHTPRIAPSSQPVPVARRADAVFGLLTLFFLNLILWSQFAYFRILSAPEVLDGSIVRSLLPFLCLLLVSVAALMFCLKLARSLSFASMLRWGLPIILLSYVVLYLDYTNPTYKTLAYTVNFIGMFGVLIGMWVVTPKYIKRTHAPLPLLLGVLTGAQGLGFFAGTAFALGVVYAISGANAIMISLVFFAADLFVAMMVGFSPRWLFFNSEFRWDEEDVDDGPVDDLCPDQDLGALFARKAEALRRDYGLSRRETEVAAMLLAGRNRPYISEELTITLNTVNAHTRSIYTKCGVHAQQELMDLMQEEDRQDRGIA